MSKIIKNNLENFLVILLIFFMAAAWIFSGWPKIWQNPPIPSSILEVRAQSSTIFYETFPNTDSAWNGSSDTAQDESNWVVIQGGDGDSNDIQISNEDKANGNLPPSRGRHLTFEDCDTGIAIPNTANDLACVPIDLAGYTSVVIEYYWQSDDVDSNEWLEVSYSTDATNCVNGTWTQIDYFVNPTDDTWYKESYNLPNVDAVSTFRLRFASKSNRWNEHFYIDDVKLTGDIVAPTITVGAVGSQTANMAVPSINNYVGGAFTFISDTSAVDITQIIITDTGTVNANTNLFNINLYYETAENCEYNGDEILFGSAVSFDGAEKATVFGTMPVSASQVCVYMVLDVSSDVLDGETLEIEISDPSIEITVSDGTVSPSFPVPIPDTTTFTTGIPPATWKADEDSSITDVNKNENIRLRIQITNTGSQATDYDYILEYAVKIGGLCGDDESFIILPVISSEEHFEMMGSVYFTDGDLTTPRLTVPEAQSFVSGKMIESPSNSSGNITLPFKNYTEIEFVFQANDDAINGGDYCFRATKNGIILNEYQIYPELKIAE